MYVCMTICMNICIQQAFTCLKLTIETNTRTRREICSKLTTKTPERDLMSFWCLYC